MFAISNLRSSSFLPLHVTSCFYWLRNKIKMRFSNTCFTQEECILATVSVLQPLRELLFPKTLNVQINKHRHLTDCWHSQQARSFSLFPQVWDNRIYKEPEIEKHCDNSEWPWVLRGYEGKNITGHDPLFPVSTVVSEPKGFLSWWSSASSYSVHYRIYQPMTFVSPSWTCNITITLPQTTCSADLYVKKFISWCNFPSWQFFPATLSMVQFALCRYQLLNRSDTIWWRSPQSLTNCPDRPETLCTVFRTVFSHSNEDDKHSMGWNCVWHPYKSGSGKHCIEVNGQITFRSHFTCAMKCKYDVCQSKRLFSTSITVCFSQHGTFSLRKGTKKDENHNKSAHIDNCSYVTA